MITRENWAPAAPARRVDDTAEVLERERDRDLVLVVVGGKDGYVERDGHMVDPADVSASRIRPQRV